MCFTRAMEEKATRSGDQTDLNIYLCDNQGYDIGDLGEWVTYLAESDRITGHAGNYVANHTFSEDVADDNISLVTISTPAKNREDDFVFVTNNGYLWVLTTIHSDWREKTIENLLGYLPCVERLYLSADDLEDLTERIRDSRISGFTAKYHAPNRERDATLTFSGAEPGDLEKAEETFDAKPTRIEFDQTNSPSTAIQGANTNEGRLTMRSVRRGSEGKAVETLIGLTDGYQKLDRQSFDVELAPTIRDLDNGFTVDGFTAVDEEEDVEDILPDDGVLGVTSDVDTADSTDDTDDTDESAVDEPIDMLGVIEKTERDARDGDTLHPDLAAIAAGFCDDDGETGGETTWDLVRNLYESAAKPAGQRWRELTTSALKQRARQKAVEVLEREHEWAAKETESRDDRGPLMWYNPVTGAYERNGSTIVGALLEEELGEHKTSKEIEEIVDKLHDRNAVDPDEFGGPAHKVCVSNGVVDLKTGGLLEHDSDYLFQHSKPVEYRPDMDARDTEMWEFLREIQPDETRRKTMVEFAGHSLRGDYKPAGFLIMHGGGANGKTTYANCIVDMHGGENSRVVSGEELEDIAEGDYALGQLKKAHVNVAADMEDVKIDRLGALKSLTGEDVTTANAKWERLETFTNRATMIFGANDAPILNESTDALGRRLYHVYMPRQFTDEDDGNPDKDPDLKERLKSDRKWRHS